MKESPILFNTEMVRAVLDGRKTQTRRVIKPQPDMHKRRHRWAYVMHHNRLQWGRAPWPKTDPMNFIVEQERKCPYGGIGDRLWVRETWCPPCDGGSGQIYYKEHQEKLPEPFCLYPGKWKPSIFMPRWASRINLEITDVRVEQVQEISETDAMAEGTKAYKGTIDIDKMYRRSFQDLWDSINKDRGFGWDTNPWVWVVGFKRIT